MLARNGVQTGGQAEEWAGMGTHRVADRLEEEQREEAPHSGPAGSKRDAEREGHARDGVDAQQERGIDPSEEDHADEAVPNRHNVTASARMAKVQGTAQVFHSPADGERYLAV